MTTYCRRPTCDLRMIDFIREFQVKHGYSPSVREIGKAFSINSTSVVHRHLHRLQRDGYIQIASRISRGIVIVHSILPNSP